MQPNLTISTLKKLLETRSDGLLYQGHHDPPNGDCKMCVRELRCLALGMDEWTDEPDGGSPTDLACQVLNDALWTSPAARTEACLPLALLSEKTAPDGWVARYAERIIKEILPMAPDPRAAHTAARAAAYAAHASCAAQAAVDASRAAVHAAIYTVYDRDPILRKAVQILLECHGVK